MPPLQGFGWSAAHSQGVALGFIIAHLSGGAEQESYFTENSEQPTSSWAEETTRYSLAPIATLKFSR